MENLNSRKLPTFLIAGCGKCGTTTLAFLLNHHPDVVISTPKEPNFLSDEHIYNKGWQWYESLFEQGQNCLARGDASVSYSLEETEEKIGERIYRYLPNIKIIYIARNPFKRLESVYREHHNSGYHKKIFLPYSLEKALQYRPAMLTNSLYWQRTAIFRSILPEAQILYLCLEDLRDHPNQVLSQCFKFIGVNASFSVPESNRQLNQGAEKFYDTKLMRFIRTRQLLDRNYENIPKKIKQKLQPYLRKPFQKLDIAWNDSLKQTIIDTIRDDVVNYLLACNKPDDFWGKEFIK